MEVGAAAAYGYRPDYRRYAAAGSREYEADAGFCADAFDPRCASQREMYEFLKEQDRINGTEGSYEKLMKYADIAREHGYISEGDLYGDDANEQMNWCGMIYRVMEDCFYLGMERQRQECAEFGGILSKAAVRNIDLGRMRAVDMRESAMLTYKGSALPRDILAAVTKAIYSNTNMEKYDLQRLDQIWAAVVKRIENRLAEGSADTSVRTLCDEAVSAIESMRSELENYFGELPESDPELKRDISEMADLYNGVICELAHMRENVSTDGGDGEDAVNQAAGDKGEGDAKGAGKEGDTAGQAAGLRDQLIDYIAELYRKIVNGETEQKFPIGAMELTIREWERLLDKFDEIEDEIRAQIREAIGKLKERQDAQRKAAGGAAEEDALWTTEKVTKSVFREKTQKEEELSYITCFREDGIICRRTGQSAEQYLWKLDYRDADEYDRVMTMLRSFPDDWELRFACNEAFWKDYLDEKIDAQDFIRHMSQYTVKGKPDYLKEKAGNIYVDRDALKYAKYLNPPEDKLYTQEEFMRMIAGQTDSGSAAQDAGGAAQGGNGAVKDGYRNYYSEHYTWKADNENRFFRLYTKDGSRLGTFRYEDLVIRRDEGSGIGLLISEHGTMSNYSAVYLDEELKKTLSNILETRIVPSEGLKGYTVKTHGDTGIRYLVREGEEGRGGRTLITSPAEQAAFDRLAERYMSQYPGLIRDAGAAAIYADLEIRGLAKATPNGILTMGWDFVKYNDGRDHKRDWAIRWRGGTDRYERLFSWFVRKREDTWNPERFSSWRGIFDGIGDYERIWSKEEEEQGYLNN